MAHLLAVSRIQSAAMKRKGTVPLMMEYSVSPETAPYLVTSTSSVMWINEAHPNDVVKAAVRSVTLDDFFLEVVEAVKSMGSKMEWGNVQPLTLEGLRAAIEHVEFYGMGAVELLIPRSHRPAEGPEEPEDVPEEIPLTDEVPLPDAFDDDAEEPEVKKRTPVDLMPPRLRPLLEDIGIPFRPCSWVPDDTIVVVPKDRSYVGVVTRLTTKKIVGVVHNAARGIAVVTATGSRPAPHNGPSGTCG